MTLKEAIDSGKRFRHPEEPLYWYDLNSLNLKLVLLSFSMAISDQWETEDFKAEITDREFWEIVKDVTVEVPMAGQPYVRTYGRPAAEKWFDKLFGDKVKK